MEQTSEGAVTGVQCQINLCSKPTPSSHWLLDLGLSASGPNLSNGDATTNHPRLAVMMSGSSGGSVWWWC